VPPGISTINDSTDSTINDSTDSTINDSTDGLFFSFDA